MTRLNLKLWRMFAVSNTIVGCCFCGLVLTATSGCMSTKNSTEDRIVGYWRTDSSEIEMTEIAFLPHGVWVAVVMDNTEKNGRDKMISRSGTYTIVGDKIRVLSPEGSVISGKAIGEREFAISAAQVDRLVLDGKEYDRIYFISSKPFEK